MNDYLSAHIARVVKEVFDQQVSVEISRPEANFGDAATNVAMKLAKTQKASPREIAQKLTEKLRTDKKFSEVEIAGPGFINLRLSDKLIVKLLDKPGKHAPHEKQNIVIETNNPNPFKDLHIGHAYNSIVADTLANLLEAGGGDVHRVSYHGDVGLHVGKSMWAILKFLDGDILKLETVAPEQRANFLSQKYIEGAAAYEDDAQAKQKIDELAEQSFLLIGEYFKEVYETCRAWSFDYLAQTLKNLGCQEVEKKYLESEANKKGRKVVLENIPEVFEDSDNAVIFPGEKYGLHTRVFIGSRGQTLYEARDLGLMQLKQKDFNPQKSFIVTAEEQKAYFQVVFKAAELAMPETKHVTQNISTGTVKLSTGKMKSRTGEVLNIEWLFEKLYEAAETRRVEADKNVIIGALRYAFLKVRVGSDVIFDVNESISIEGNSGPYLQYAHARARSILGKRGRVEKTEITSELQPDEKDLALKLAEFSDVSRRASAELLPHIICTYLYELAQTFNRFYENNRVLDNEREALRLQLVLRYAEILKNGLYVLGIPAPDRL